MSGPITQDLRRGDSISHAWPASMSTLDAHQWHQLRRTVPHAEGLGQRCTGLRHTGGGQGAIPSPQPDPERWLRSETTLGKGRRAGSGRAVWGRSRDGDPTKEPSPTGDASLLSSMPRRPHV